MKRIHISEVLEMISSTDDDTPTVFQIGWVRSSGPRKGQIKYVAKCRRGIPKSKTSLPREGAPRSERKRPLHIDRGTLPLIDAESGQYLTPLVSHIVEFNLSKVVH
jgi:hypothetical protein